MSRSLVDQCVIRVDLSKVDWQEGAPKLYLNCEAWIMNMQADHEEQLSALGKGLPYE